MFGNIVMELLKYTKIISDRIKYYDAIVDFTDESHWFNPFYNKEPEVMVIWTDDVEQDTGYE